MPVGRFDAAPPAMSASVHVYADGSVLVSTGGLEMGQGLFTKVKQARPVVPAYLGVPISGACCWRTYVLISGSMQNRPAECQHD